MRLINIQVQPDRAKRLDMTAVDARLRRLAKNKRLVRRFSFDEGDEKGSYLNFSYLSANPAELWRALRNGALRSLPLRSASIVVCEGDNSWDDYLLLHHFDRRLKVDRAPANSNNVFKGRRAKRARP